MLFRLKEVFIEKFFRSFCQNIFNFLMIEILIFLSLGVACKIEGIRGGFVSLSLVERKTVKKRRGFSLFAVVLGFCGFCCRAKGV